MTAQVVIALLVGVAAIIDDLARRRIANWIPAVALVGGVAASSFERGWMGAGSSLLGAVGGFGVFLVFYLLGGMGGGDVKLMAGFGAVLGWERLIEAALWTAGCGGLIAVGTLAVAAVGDRLRKPRAGAGTAVVAIPYAPAIALGSWLSLVPKG
jgi:prepilin peptidase CpaA